jgi:hypothetical protein
VKHRIEQRKNVREVTQCTASHSPLTPSHSFSFCADLAHTWTTKGAPRRYEEPSEWVNCLAKDEERQPNGSHAKRDPVPADGGDGAGPHQRLGSVCGRVRRLSAIEALLGPVPRAPANRVWQRTGRG